MSSRARATCERSSVPCLEYEWRCRVACNRCVCVRGREAYFDINEEDLRCYFPLDRVMDGLFGLATHLFGVDIEVGRRGTRLGLR